MAKRFAFRAEYWMVGEGWLVDFNTDDHVYLLLLVAVGDEPVYRAQTFHVDIRIYATFGIDDEVA